MPTTAVATGVVVDDPQVPACNKTLGTLIGLRAVEAGIRRRRTKVQRRLEVYGGDTAKLDKLLDFVQRIDPTTEQIDFTRDGDGGQFQARRIVDSIPLIADHVRFLQGFDDVVLLRRRDPGENPVFFHRLDKLVFRHLLQLFAGKRSDVPASFLRFGYKLGILESVDVSLP